MIITITTTKVPSIHGSKNRLYTHIVEINGRAYKIINGRKRITKEYALAYIRKNMED